MEHGPSEAICQEYYHILETVIDRAMIVRNDSYWDGGLLPGHHQAIIRANANLLWNGPPGTDLNEIWMEIQSKSY